MLKNLLSVLRLKKGPGQSSDPIDAIRLAICEPGDDTGALARLLAEPLDLKRQPGEAVFPVLLMGDMIMVNYRTFPLILAAMLYKPERTRLLLAHGARIDVACAHRRTPLHWAIVGEADSNLFTTFAAMKRENPSQPPPRISAISPEQQADSLATTRILLEHGADPNASDALGHTPLHRASSVGGKAEHIKLLVARGARIDAATRLGITPLIIAAQVGSIDAAAALLAAGADPNRRGEKNSTALHWACSRGDAEIARLLLAAKADPNLEDQDGLTPLRLAVDAGWARTVEVLRAAGVSGPVPSGGGQERLLEALRQGNLAAVETLLASIDVNAADSEGITLLHRAVALNAPLAMVSLLLERGARKEVADELGRRPLHWAAGEGFNDLVTLLISRGAEVNAVSTNGCNALHFAAARGQAQVIQALVDAGADPWALDEKGFTPLANAVVRNHFNAAEVLAVHGTVPPQGRPAGISPLILAAGKGAVRMVRLLLEHPVDLEATTQDGWTALHEAVAHGPEIPSLLLEAGANVNAASKAGYTPLHRAAAKGQKAVIKLLIEHGADVNATDAGGKSVADFARSSDSAEKLQVASAVLNAAPNHSEDGGAGRFFAYLRTSLEEAPQRLAALRKTGQALISGGDGSSTECPVVIHAPDIGCGVVAIHDYLDQQFGPRRQRRVDGKKAPGPACGWQFEGASSQQQGDRHLNCVELTLPQGSQRTLYFDVTEWADLRSSTAVIMAHACLTKPGPLFGSK